MTNQNTSSPNADSPTSTPHHNRKWYVLKTKPRAERLVADLLTGRHIQVYLPLLWRRRIEPLFPGYLFLRIDCESDEHLRCRSAPGVSHILSADGVPIPVDDDLIEGIWSRVKRENSQDPAERFPPGDRVVITQGPLRDVEAIFDRALSAWGRCLVLMGLLGSHTRVQIDATDLAKRTH